MPDTRAKITVHPGRGKTIAVMLETECEAEPILLDRRAPSPD